MTGCFNDIIDNAEADGGDEVSPVIAIITFQLGPDEEVNITLNDTSLEFVSAWSCVHARDYCETTTALRIEMTCDDPAFYDGEYFFNKVNWFTPNYAGTECVMNIKNEKGEQEITRTYSFIEHQLA